MRILHVLTLVSDTGEYGGPVKVAREICNGLSYRGHQSEIIAGYKVSQSLNLGNYHETRVRCRAFTRTYYLSSLFSFEIVAKLFKKIKENDFVHIHFGRDLISITAAILCMVLQVPFALQTHGMICRTSSKIKILFDKIIVKTILKKAKNILVLNRQESEEFSSYNLGEKVLIIPNGIGRSLISPMKNKNNHLKIIFCARLDKNKGVQLFIDIANSRIGKNEYFEIYGPDFGELKFIEEQLTKTGCNKNLSYCGVKKSKDILQLLHESDLLILPSKVEFYPMIVLEALSVGTPVLVSPSCGIAKELSSINKNFVAESYSIDSFLVSYQELLENKGISRENLVIQSDLLFGIDKVIDQLLTVYQTH